MRRDKAFILISRSAIKGPILKRLMENDSSASTMKTVSFSCGSMNRWKPLEIVVIHNALILIHFY